jgi:CoA:oxalate CoA-transferase
LRATIETWSSALTVDEVNRILGGAGIPVAPIRNLQEALESDHAAHRALLTEVRRDGGHTKRVPSQPVKFSSYGANCVSPAPALGEHADALLQQLGYDADDIASLRERGAFGVHAISATDVNRNEERDHA